MGALPALLAEGLPEKALSTGRRVTRVGPGRVEVDGETLRARAVVVATDPRAAGELLPGLDAPEMRTLTTYHHAATDPARRRGPAAPRRHGRPDRQHRRDARERRPARPGAGVVDGRRRRRSRSPRSAASWAGSTARRPTAGSSCASTRCATRCPRSPPDGRCAARSSSARACSWRATTATPRPSRARWCPAAAPRSGASHLRSSPRPRRRRAQNVLATSRARASAAASSAARSPVSVGWKRMSLTSVRPVQRSQSSK